MGRRAHRAHNYLARGGTEMNLVDPALSNDVFQVARAEPSSGHDGDLIASADKSKTRR